MNLASIIESHDAERPCLISRRDVTTYGQLRDQVAHLRGGFAARGIGPGDRVVIVCATNWYFVAGYLAALGVGAIAVPLNPASPTAELEAQVRAVDADAIWAGPAGRTAVAALPEELLSSLKALVVMQEPVEDMAGAVLVDELLAAEPAPLVERDDDDVAVLVFTSGTAGSPKAAMLSHGNLTSNLAQVQRHPQRALRADDVSFGVLPLSHIFGLNVVLGLTLYTGASVVLAERFDPMSALEAIARNKCSIVVGAPPMWQAWAMLPEIPEGAFDTVRLAVTGASRLEPHVAELVTSRLGVTLSQGYGLTEASPVVTSSVGDEPRPESIGRPLPGLEVRLVDEEGHDALVGDSGEIWVRGPNVFLGYLDDEEATSAVLTPDGWLRTGDIGVSDDDGRLHLVNRSKDVIIVSGFNVFPGEVEEVLVSHAGVREAAVVGVAHPTTGETVKAFVVVEPGQSAEEDLLIRFCEDRLARYKCPSKIEFVPELPRGLGGKVLRRQLR